MNQIVVGCPQERPLPTDGSILPPRRLVAYVCMTPASRLSEWMITKRQQAFVDGHSSTHWPEDCYFKGKTTSLSLFQLNSALLIQQACFFFSFSLFLFCFLQLYKKKGRENTGEYVPPMLTEAQLRLIPLDSNPSRK